MKKASIASSFAMVGLGRMGGNMVRRLARAGHPCFAWDREKSQREQFTEPGVCIASDMDGLVRSMTRPRAVWLMVPAGVTPQVAQDVTALLEEGDVLIDGGNSHYRAAVDRAPELKQRGVYHVDVGTSGGVHGLSRGYCLMVGGEVEGVALIEPYLKCLVPGYESVSRTLGRDGDPSSSEHGYLHCGPAGAGHFVKMVHNAIEYGMMAAYAEGFNLLKRAGVGLEGQTRDAETAPLFDSRYYHYDFNVAEIAELWRRGSVIPSWLLDLSAQALLQDPELTQFSGQVSDSGEGRWAMQAAIDEGVPAHVLSAALFDRFSSRGKGEFSSKVLSAMRLGFGGHLEKSK